RDHATRRSHVRGVEGGEAGIATEDPEYADPLVRAERCALAIDRLLRPGDGGREPDAVLGALDVVVHRLRDGHQRDSGIGEHLRVGQRVVPADRDKHGDTQRLWVFEDQRRQVEEVLVDAVSLAVRLTEPWREPGITHLAWVRPRRVQDPAAGPVDGPGVDPVQASDVAAATPIRELGLDVREALPADADAAHT